jgi:hypothetical protein
VMMNAARLHVAVQGLGHTEAAFQNASQYANERLQMRAVASSSPAAAGKLAASPPAQRASGNAVVVDRIVRHPPIRRTLLELRAFTQGERAIGYWLGHLLDLAEHHPDAGKRRECHQLASLLTPLAKAFFTENGFELASKALQVFGGHGYVHDNAIEQTLRDSRIPMIYEGTNEIQAVDLLVRKVLGDGGQAFECMLGYLHAEAAACDECGCGEFAASLRTAATALAAAVKEVGELAAVDAELPHRVAGDFLRAFGLVLLAFAWARSARLARPRAQVDPFYRDKLVTAQFFFDYLLPTVDLHLRLMRVARKGLPFIDSPNEP